VAFYIAHAPEPTSLEAMVLAAGQRWPVEECFESAKGEGGLGDDEVRTYTGYAVLGSAAFLAAARVMAHEQKAALRPKVLALPCCRDSMERFRRRQDRASSASHSKKSGA
jgi:SRSO17 transposase